MYAIDFTWHKTMTVVYCIMGIQAGHQLYSLHNLHGDVASSHGAPRFSSKSWLKELNSSIIFTLGFKELRHQTPQFSA